MNRKSYSVGIVKYTDHASLNRIEMGIKSGLDRLSEKHGIKLDYEGRVYDGQANSERMREIARKLADEGVDLVISIATPPTVAMKGILEERKIRMLFRAVSDPISAKVVDSLERPGAYITGTSDSLDGAELAGGGFRTLQSGPRKKPGSMKVDLQGEPRAGSMACETQTAPEMLNGITCVPTVFTRVQKSGSERYLRNQWINRVAPAEGEPNG